MTLSTGDVINTRPPKRSIWWQATHPFESVPQGCIQAHQRHVGYADWRDTHSMLYFGPARILSVTYPHTKWETWDRVQQRDFRVWRPTFPLDSQDVLVMYEAAHKLIGTSYDVGQLLDIALNEILGYGVGFYHRIFDFGGNLMVCSVGVRACFDAARKAKESAGQPPPFDVLFTQGGQKLNVERTPPAAYANTPARFAQAS
jgi:hypothetical protein